MSYLVINLDTQTKEGPDFTNRHSNLCNHFKQDGTAFAGKLPPLSALS